MDGFGCICSKTHYILLVYQLIGSKTATLKPEQEKNSSRHPVAMSSLRSWWCWKNQRHVIHPSTCIHGFPKTNTAVSWHFRRRTTEFAFWRSVFRVWNLCPWTTKNRPFWGPKFDTQTEGLGIYVVLHCLWCFFVCFSWSFDPFNDWLVLLVRQKTPFSPKWSFLRYSTLGYASPRSLLEALSQL